MYRILPQRSVKLGRILGFICIQDHAAANNRCRSWQTGGLSELVSTYLPTLSYAVNHHSLTHSTAYHHRQNNVISNQTQTSSWLKLNSALLNSSDSLTLATPGILPVKFFRNYTTQPSEKSGGTDPGLKNIEDGSSQTEGEGQIEDAADKPRGIIQRFKDAYKQYGKVLICVHVATSAVWFGCFYYAAYSGIDVVPILKSLGASDRVIAMFHKAGIGDIAVAYLLYKIATPARYTVTIGGTHWVVRHLRGLGHMEAVPEGDRIRDLVRDSREHVQTKVKDKYVDLKDDIKKKKVPTATLR